MREFTEQEQVRRDKLEEIKKVCNPYPDKFKRTHTLNEAKSLEDNTSNVSLAGRIVFMRKMGKLSFIRIRDLEGSITRIVAYKATFNIPEVTLDIAKEALQEFVSKTVYRTNSVSKIIDIVAKYFGLESSMLKGKMKKKNVTDARAIAMYLSRIMTDESLQRIGLEFGGRDHSTVIYSHEKISNELKTNVKLQEEIKTLKEKICE